MRDARPWKDQPIDDNFVSSWWSWWNVVKAVNGPAIPGPSGILIIVLGLAWWGATLSSEDRMLEVGDGWLAAVREVSDVLQGDCDGNNQASSGEKYVPFLHVFDLTLTTVGTRRKISGAQSGAGNAKRCVTSSRVPSTMVLLMIHHCRMRS